MRTAFIRVSYYNNTQNGEVIYTLSDLVSEVKNWNLSKGFKFYIKEHNGESGDPHPHCHIVLDFDNATEFDVIKKHFPYGDIETAKSIKKSVQYLIHMNDISKTQYDFSSIITNDSKIDRFKYQSKVQQVDKLNLILADIESGKIREYNLFESVPIDIFVENKTKLYNALEYKRGLIMTNKDRNIDVLIFSGDTATFKTTYAKQYARNSNKSFCISSSSNDPMQDYKGEDVLILDDIRDTTFKFHDLLKILDNHTNSTITSRYSNKAFIGDTIIITTSIPISDWYFDETKEDKEQLYRRIPTQMQFTKEFIRIYKYKDTLHKYVFFGQIPNVNMFTPEKSKDYTLDILDKMGVVLDDEVKSEFLEQYDKNTNDYTDMTLGEIFESTDDILL